MTKAIGYNPHEELTEQEKVVASLWECLRRNNRFRQDFKQWQTDPEFRKQHAVTENYHNKEAHYARCAFDWALSTAERLELARCQITNRYWFRDTRFNFGRITFGDSLVPEPGKNGTRLSVDQCWRAAPAGFRKQFRFAWSPPCAMEEITDRLREDSKLIRELPEKIWAKKEVKEAELIRLQKIGIRLAQDADRNKIFAIPNGHWPEKSFDELSDRFRTAFSGKITPGKKYNLHGSYLGTQREWLAFLLLKRFGSAGAAKEYGKLQGTGDPRFDRLNESDFVSTCGPVIHKGNRKIEQWIEIVYPPTPFPQL